jgi:ribosomal protein L33
MAKVKRDIVAFNVQIVDSKTIADVKTKNIKEKMEMKKYCPVCKNIQSIRN